MENRYIKDPPLSDGTDFFFPFFFPLISEAFCKPLGGEENAMVIRLLVCHLNIGKQSISDSMVGIAAQVDHDLCCNNGDFGISSDNL